MIRVLVAASTGLACQGLRRALAGEGIEVVGQVQSVGELLRDLEALAPEVMVVALSREDLERAADMSLLEAVWQRVPVVVVWMSERDPALLLGGLAWGATSWLAERGAAEDLRLAVEAAVRGLSLVDTAGLRSAVQGLLEERRRAQAAGGEGGVDVLTPRELEVLRLIVRGMSNGEIALSLAVSEGTVRTHVGHILSKLQVSSRLGAALLAIRCGLASLQGGPSGDAGDGRSSA